MWNVKSLKKALSVFGFGAPFLEKGPPKITEGDPFDPQWPISRINRAVRTSDLMSLEVRGAPVGEGHKRNCARSPYTFSFRLRLRMNQ